MKQKREKVIINVDLDTPDEKTMRRIEKELKVTKVKGQKTNNARVTRNLM